MFLTERLPKANYSKPIKSFTKKNENDLPELKMKNKKKKESKLPNIENKEPELMVEEKKLKNSESISKKNELVDNNEELERKQKSKASMDNSIVKSPKHLKNLDLSTENIQYEKIERMVLPSIKGKSPSEYKYELPSINITKEKNQKYTIEKYFIIKLKE